MEGGGAKDRPTKEKMIEGGRLGRGEKSNTAIEGERKWREGRGERETKTYQWRRGCDGEGREGRREKRREERLIESGRERFQWKLFLLGMLLALQR